MHTQTSPFSSKWLPTPGNFLFTLVIAGFLIFYVHRVEARAIETSSHLTPTTSATTLPYQGRLTDSNGNPVNAAQAMTFRLYNIASGGTALWQEAWPAVQVSDGLFNVLLGSTAPITPTLFAENNSLWLGITVGTDTEMAPRMQVGSVPFAFQASRAFGLSAADGSPQDAVVVDANGYVGIGTTDPLDTIHIQNGGIRIGNSYGSITQNWWEFGPNNDTYGVGIDFHGSTTLTDYAARIYRLAGDNGQFEIVNQGTGSLIFHTNNLARVTITGDGNVGIGTTDPRGKLDVAIDGTQHPTIKLTNTYTGIGDIVRTYYMEVSNNGCVGNKLVFGYLPGIDVSGVCVGDGAIMALDNLGNVGIGTVFPSHKLDVVGDIYASGNICANNGSNCVLSPSDLRLKTNITLLTHPLDKLAQLRGVTFDWNDEALALGLSGDAPHIGVIAQEVEAVFPEMVTTMENGYKAVDYSKLSAVLIEAVKELQAEKESEIAALKADNAALQDQVTSLENRMIALEQAVQSGQPVHNQATPWYFGGTLVFCLLVGLFTAFNLHLSLHLSKRILLQPQRHEVWHKDHQDQDSLCPS